MTQEEIPDKRRQKMTLELRLTLEVKERKVWRFQQFQARDCYIFFYQPFQLLPFFLPHK